MVIFAVLFALPSRPPWWACVTRCASEPGWQLTWWISATEPGGHTIRDTAAEAIEEALRDGWIVDRVTGPGAREGQAIVDAAVSKWTARKAEIDAWIRGIESGDDGSVPA